jgi:hypothetical protein
MHWTFAGWVEIEKFAIVSGLWVDADESQAKLLLETEG